MLEIKSIFSGYGKNEVLHGISMRAKDGEITAIVGPNGCGKSTLLKTIVGILKPTQGRILFDGKDVTGLKPHTAIQRGICFLPQGRTVFRYMTVLENLELLGYSNKNHNQAKERLEEAYNMFPILRDKEKELAGTLSGGQQTMLTLAKAVIVKPKLVLMDEPSLGLAPKILDTTYEKILELNENGMSIILVEQNVRRALSVCDYTYVLGMGQNQFEEEPDALLKDKDILRRFLGI